MDEIRFTMLWQDKNAEDIVEYFNTIGIAAYYKGTGFEQTGIMLPMQEPTIFVDENKVDEAMVAYEEWKNTVSYDEGMDQDEIESTNYYKQKRYMTKLYYAIFGVFFGGSILFLLYAISQ